MVFGNAVAQDERPNILLIVADDLGFTDLGAFGSEIPTPTLDALAYEGVRLTNFHTGRACQQTRSMLMSGRGYSGVIQHKPLRADGERANELRTDVATVPELLREAGYRTYMSGKWDLGLTRDTMPVARGFDRSFALLEASSSQFAEYFWDKKSYYQEDSQALQLEDLPADFYTTQTYTDKMLEYLQAHDDAAPWFGYVAYTAPHWPLQVPDEWLDRYAGNYDAGYDVLRTERARRATELGVIPDGASLANYKPTAAQWSTLTPDLQKRYARSQEIYASMIELLDQQIGRLVSYLEETGQLENTVIFFMSDHGASAAEIGVMDGPSSMPEHFNGVVAQRDNTLANIGRIGSFVDHGRGFGEAVTAPLKYFKGSMFEGGIRAAAFVHYPAAIRRAEINNTFVTVMDILPSFLDIADTEHPGAVRFNGRDIQSIQGRSFWPHLTGNATTVHGDDHAAGWSAGPVGAIIEGKYKLINQPAPGVRITDTVPPWHLYDINSDPGEINDIASMHPELVESLARKWEQHWR
jgi:arylsulfatase